MANYESLVLYDSDGNSLSHLTQWDINQTILIGGAKTSPLPTIHFKSNGFQDAVLVKPTIVNGKLSALVPNFLLQFEYPIFVYVYYHNEDDSSDTEYMSVVPVRPRAKPLDFIYVENIEYPNWFEVKELLRKLSENVASLSRELVQTNATIEIMNERIVELESAK